MTINNKRNQGLVLKNEVSERIQKLAVFNGISKLFLNKIYSLSWHYSTREDMKKV